MSRSEEAMGGEHPDTGKGTCRRPRGKQVWVRMESGEATEKGKNVK